MEGPRLIYTLVLQDLDFRGLGGEVFGVFPGQADGMDFCGFWLVEAVA
jgi:hypothetical protein